MKLQTVKKILNEVVPLLHVEVNPVTINGTQYSKIIDFTDAQTAVTILNRNGLFANELDFLIRSPLFEFAQRNSFNTEYNTGVAIKSYIDRIRNKAEEFLKLLDDSLPDSTPTSIFIKLGDIKDLKDLAISAANFNKILEQIILEPEIGGFIEVKSVDNGSIWIEVSIGTNQAIALIGAVAYAAAFVHREYQKTLMLAEERKTKKLTNERLAKLNDASAILLDELLEAEAEKIQVEFFSEQDNERLERLKNSIRMISEEYKKGSEIQASLTAPKEIQNFFPDMKNLLALLPRTKELGDSDNK